MVLLRLLRVTPDRHRERIPEQAELAHALAHQYDSLRQRRRLCLLADLSVV